MQNHLRWQPNHTLEVAYMGLRILSAFSQNSQVFKMGRDWAMLLRHIYSCLWEEHRQPKILTIIRAPKNTNLNVFQESLCCFISTTAHSWCQEKTLNKWTV